VKDCSRDSVIVPDLVENLKLAFGHYFDRELGRSALHHPASNFVGLPGCSIRH